MSFIIVSYPFPVPSAHVELTGTNRRPKVTNRRRNPRAERPVVQADEQREVVTAAKA